MDVMSVKRQNRLERKKQKMAALLEVAKLNEIDRAHKNKLTASDVDTTGTGETEPSPKRFCPIIQADDNLDLIKTHIQLGPSGKPKLSGEEFIRLKKLLREKTSIMRALPKFRLRDQGDNASLSVNFEDRVPLFMSDIQHLMLHSLLGHHSPYSPSRWCQLDKFNKLISTSVLIIDNLSLYEYTNNESQFSFINSNYAHKLEMISPKDSVQDLATFPVTSTQMKKFLTQYETLDLAASKGDVYDLFKNSFPMNETSADIKSDIPHQDKFPRTHLLLSGWEMIEENFPMPIKGMWERKFAGYVLTKDSYSKVTPDSPMFGIDCEMCMTTTKELELTRVSILDEKLQSVYDELVLPHNKIIDYLTKYSGITAKMMRNVTKRMEDVQQDIRKLLPGDAILVGQSLNNDMHALRMMHPYVIDTSIIFNITGERNRKTKLQTLAREFLSERIQEGRGGHCSAEDSAACLKLVKLKLSKSLYFGDAVMSDVQLHLKSHPELGSPHYATSMLKQATKMEKNAFIVANADTISKYSYYTFKKLEQVNNDKILLVSEASNKGVIKNTVENLTKNSLNIAHISVPEAPYSEENASKVYRNVDKWARQMYESSATCSLNIVIFAGIPDTANGCCFINLK